MTEQEYNHQFNLLAKAFLSDNQFDKNVDNLRFRHLILGFAMVFSTIYGDLVLHWGSHEDSVWFFLLTYVSSVPLFVYDHLHTMKKSWSYHHKLTKQFDTDIDNLNKQFLEST